MKKKKVAVVLFNLGGPDSLKSVRPFLFNLFYDKYIIRLINPFRYLIAKLISTLRNKTAQEIYSNTGNKSPILEETENQRQSLEEMLNDSQEGDIVNSTNHSDNCSYKVFIAMRHWHPFSYEAIDKIKEFSPDEIILLPLYPQLSTTTSISSIEDFKDNWSTRYKESDSAPKPIIKTICCYPLDDKFISAHAQLLMDKIKLLQNKENFRILFSAHGLPEKIIEQGDPYQWQVEQTVSKLVEEIKSSLNANAESGSGNLVKIDDLDYKVTYQSRVGPVEWLKPNTEDEIELAIEENKSLIIVPIAFVSEHVETLVELDIEYGEIAIKGGIEYLRVPTLSVNKLFIESLSDMVKDFANSDFSDLEKEGNSEAFKNVSKGSRDIIFPSTKKRICPTNFKDCPCRR